MPPSTLEHWMQWLENSAWSSAIRQSIWLYPTLEIVHITGIVVLVGAAFLFDLRLLGFSTALPVSALERHLLSWSMRALILVVPSGILLFITNAMTLARNPVFHTKLILLMVASVNAWVFHKIICKSVSGWNVSTPSPVAAKMTAVISILVWIAIISCGRLLAY